MQPPEKIKLELEIDKPLWSFIKLLKANHKKSGISESEFVNQLLVIAVQSVLKVNLENTHEKQ